MQKSIISIDFFLLLWQYYNIKVYIDAKIYYRVVRIYGNQKRFIFE